MKKTIVFLLIFYCSVQLFASKVDTLLVYSESMQKTIKNVVITPDSYPEKEKKYAVVYLLHGAGGNHKSWLEKAPDIGSYADLYDVILVCPNGHRTSWYFDAPLEKHMRYETFITKELISEVDKSYNTLGNKYGRAITGYSMGGHGALFLAFRHTHVFGVAASMSGGVDVRGFPLQWEVGLRLGKYAEHSDNWDKNMVINQVHKLNGKNLKFLFDCGTDDFFYDANVRLHKKLLEHRIPHDYIERPGGHTNAYWANSIKYQMLFFNDFFNKSNNKNQ